MNYYEPDCCFHFAAILLVRVHKSVTAAESESIQTRQPLRFSDFSAIIFILLLWFCWIILLSLMLRFYNSPETTKKAMKSVVWCGFVVLILIFCEKCMIKCLPFFGRKKKSSVNFYECRQL